MVAIFVILGLILLAFVVDRGRVYATQSQMQNAVDAAALAGAQEFCVGGNAAQVAVNYAGSNGLAPGTVLVDDDGTLGDVRFINVRASQVVDMLFGSFVGTPKVAVAVQATAQRTCLSEYQFVADNDFNFNGSGATVGGGIFAGKCFEGSSGTFSLVAVSTDDDPPYDCSPFHNGTLPIKNGSKNPVCATGSIGQCLYNMTNSTTTAFEKIFGVGSRAAIETSLDFSRPPLGLASPPLPGAPLHPPVRLPCGRGRSPSPAT